MLGTYSRNELVEQENNSEIEMDLESRRRQEDTNFFGGNFRSSLNANMSVNSEITAETSRAINSEISTQMSRRLEEIRSDINSHILEVMNSAIEEKVLPTIRNAVRVREGAKTTKWDLRSDGRHQNVIGPMTQDHDRESDGRQ